MNKHFRLVENGFKFCLVTNECTTAKKRLVKKLNEFGFDCVTAEKLISPAPVACSYLEKHNLRPRLHIWDGVIEDFQPLLDKQPDPSLPPNCLVVGDVMDKLSRNFMDESLELMLNSPEKPQIISLGAGRYYRDGGRLRMDTGAYVVAFEFCLGVKALNVGKPTEEFFKTALDAIGGNVEETVMIGDDIVSDVGGAQNVGMRGFLVRTGKYKKSDEIDRGIKADFVFDNLKDAIDNIISQQRQKSA